MELHSILSLCKIENKVRWPVGLSSFGLNRNSYLNEGNPNNKMLLECSGCGLTTIDGDAMCRHISKIKIDSTQKNISTHSNSKDNQNCDSAIIYTSVISNNGNFFFCFNIIIF